MTYRSDLGFRARRDAALARPELRGYRRYNLVSDGLPDQERECVVWAKMPQDTEPYRIPFPVMLRGDNWYHAVRGFQIQVEVVGWTYRN